MRLKTLWSLCVALIAALAVGAWLLPSPAAQARPLLVLTPTGLPPTATAPTAPTVPAATNTSVVPTNTASTDTATPVAPGITVTPPIRPSVTGTAIAPTGTASSPDSTATPRPTRAPAPGGPSLHIRKSSSASAGVPGDFISFTLTASNDGASTATDVTISDSVPDFLEIYNVKTTKGVASNSGQTVTVRLDSLEPGESVEVTIRVRIRDDAEPQDGSNVGVVQQPGHERVTSERVRISVLPNLTATALAGTPLAGTPTVATPAVTPAALPVTSGTGGDFAGLLLLFGAGLVALSAGWAVLGVRRR